VNPNPQIGSDVTGDGSKDKPYLTLQHAVNSHSDGNAVILAAEGTYSEGGKSGQGVNNRLYVPSSATMRIKAIGDKNKTIIEGFSDPQSPDNTGCGDAAYRCVCLDGAHCVQGFTLKGGRTAYSETYKDGEPYRGGGFWGNRTHPATLADCVITDCVAGRGAAAFGGTLLRCVVKNNAIAGTGNSIVRNLRASACLFVDNDAGQSYVIGQDTFLNQCTIAGNRQGATGNWRYTFNNSGSEAFNSVIGTTLNSIGLISGTTGSIANSLLETPALQESWRDCVADDPLFASSSDAPWKLYGCSSGVGLASASTLATPLDIEGNFYEINSSGKTVVGCYATTKPGVRGVSEFDGGVSPSEVIPVDGVKEVKFTATADRPLLYFDVNGQMVAFEVAENGERSATITFDLANGSSWIVTPVYGTTWFVDAKNGTDALGYGYTTNKPLKSLAYSIKKTLENDTLVAAPGTYDIGYSKHGEDGVVTPWASKNSLKSRVFIPSGRKLVSSEGASVTFIKGAPDTVSDTRDEYGRGPDAIRGVAMAANTLLKGFTIMEGRAGVVNEEVIENDGGGVYGYDTSSIVEDCIISNNAAYRGGGIRKGSAYRCRIVYNRSLSMGSGARDTYLYNCLIDGNVGGTSVYSTRVVSSTFGPNIPKNQNQCYSILEGAYLANNLFCTGRVDATCISNCFFQSWSDCKESMRYLITSEREPEAYGLTWGDGSLPIDGNYRPLKGSKAIDSGSLTAEYVVLTGTDLNGTQRVYNNAVDCGAFEYDWRRDYSRLLSASSSFAVTQAAPSCVAEDTSLRLINGTINATWAECPISRFTVRLSVTGKGVLRVFCNDKEIESFSSADNEVELSYKAQGHNLKFVYEQAQGDDDSVGALISSVKRHGGTMIMIM
jgi:hypothetical protein